MRSDKNIAVNLRKNGASYTSISRKLGIPKSTLSGWFAKTDWSRKISNTLIQKSIQQNRKRMILMNQVRLKKWEDWREAAREEARNNFIYLKRDPLFLPALMLYWAEGDSKIENGAVRLTNTDPKMIRIFSQFLQTTCSIPKEKLRLYIILYPDLDEKKCKTFWSKISGIPKNQFIKTQYIKGKHPTKRLSYGIGMIHVGSRQLKEKIYVWLNLYQEALLRV